MRMLGIIAYIMRFAIGGAIETVALATGDVDSIGETVFAQGIGEIPEGFGMPGLSWVEGGTRTHDIQNHNLTL